MNLAAVLQYNVQLYNALKKEPFKIRQARIQRKCAGE